MSDESTTEQRGTFEIWAFAGERFGSKAERVHVWVDSSGEEQWFKAKTAYVIGGRYRVRVERKEGGGISLFNTPAPEFVESDKSNPLVSVWQAADLAAKTRQAQRRREARAKAETTQLDNAIDTLRTIARQQRTAVDRAAFVGYVISQLSKW